VVAVLALWALVATAAPQGSRTALAQDTGTPVPAAETVPDPVAAGQVSADEVNTVARELWCPLCSGVRLDSCELKACEQMKDVIAIKLAEGEDTGSIIDYFVGQYGPQVLGQPPLEGFNWLAWILPVLVLLGGGAFLLLRSRSMVRGPAAAAASDAAAAPPSEYDRKLDEELSRYE
jgi:cytochrome c-type biogenesis protein CcmH